MTTPPMTTPPLTGTDSSDARLAALRRWLEQQAGPLGLDLNSLTAASGDASFRRYFRIHHARDGRLGMGRALPATGDAPPGTDEAHQNGPASTLIVMDAPPPHEDCRPFVHVAGLLAAGGLRVPAVLAQDLSQGFLLLSDLGRQTFHEAILAGLAQDDALLQQHYRGALRALVQLQQCPADTLPVYDETRLLEELTLFPQWYLQARHGFTPDADTQSMLASTFGVLARHAAAQPRVFVHRDFHSPNLMIGVGAPDFQPGVIDFQDALRGPLSYDVASLVMDARTTWDEPMQLDWAIRYWEYARAAGLPVPADFARFHVDYEWMGLQRNLRILGVFARLSQRDGKHHYLDHLPRVQAYVRQVAGRYAVFHPLLRLLDRVEQTPLTNGYSF